MSFWSGRRQPVVKSDRIAPFCHGGKLLFQIIQVVQKLLLLEGGNGSIYTMRMEEDYMLVNETYPYRLMHGEVGKDRETGMGSCAWRQARVEGVLLK
jgi:hypothetical protein